MGINVSQSLTVEQNAAKMTDDTEQESESKPTLLSSKITVDAEQLVEPIDKNNDKGELSNDS